MSRLFLLTILLLLASQPGWAQTTRIVLQGEKLGVASQVLAERLESEGATDVKCCWSKDKLTITFDGLADSDLIARLVATREVALQYDLEGQRRNLISNDDIESASAEPDESGAWSILFDTTPEGTRKLAEGTKELLGQSVHVVVDGEIVSSPVLTAPILDGHVLISGQFTEKEAQLLADYLNSRMSSLTLLEIRTGQSRE